MSLTNVVNILLFRQRRVFVAVFVGALAAAAVITFTRPNVYEASAILFVGENRPVAAGAEAVQLDEVLAESYAKLLDTRHVEELVAEALPFPFEAGELDDKMAFDVIPGTRLLRVTASDQDPMRAEVLANTYADTFVRDRLDTVQAATRDQVAQLNERIRELVDRIARLEANPTPGSTASLEQARTELEAVRASYRTTSENAGLASTNVSVSSQAVAPSDPAQPRPKLYLAIGFVLALALATAAALARNAFDRRVHDVDELLEIVDAPVLTRVPRLGRSEAGEQRFQESMRFLRVNLPQAPDQTPPVIAVTSAASADGKTTVVAGLASALAEVGRMVVAVDCDLRKPSLARKMGLHGTEGLTDVLLQERPVAEALQEARERVLVLGSGPVPRNPSLLLTAPAFVTMVRELRGWADFVLIDCPPILAGAETAAVFRSVTGVIMVADVGRARRDLLRIALEQLGKSNAELFGLVLNRVDERLGGYAYYEYRRPALARARTGAPGEPGADEDAAAVVEPRRH
jgi:tyrosine-protein kinase